MPSKLDKLRSKLQGKTSNITLNTEYYLLAKELGCLPDLLGRVYEVEYDSEGRICRIIQKPMSIPSFINLMKEMQNDARRQNKEMKKAKRKR